MERTWSNIDELRRKLFEILSERHPWQVTDLAVSIEGDTVVLSGEVGSEDCRADAKRQALAFEGIFKVANRLEVAAFLSPASNSSDENDYFGVGKSQQAAAPDDGDRRAEQGAPRRRGGKQTPDKVMRVRRHVSRREGAGIEYASFEGYDEPDPEHVSRYPSVTASGEIEANATVEVTVDLKTESAGESPIYFGSFAAGWTEIEVSVQIVGTWLKSALPDSGTVIVRRDGPTTPAKFTCVVASDYQPDTPAMLQVYFLHGTRICGSMQKDLAPADLPGSSSGSREPATPTGKDQPAVGLNVVTMVPEAPGPALSVRISGGEDRQHWSWSAYGPKGISTGSDEIQLGSSAKEFAAMLLASCPDLPPASFRRRMKGVGETIWRKAPAGFREVYVECRRSLGPKFPIQFNSDDPHVPWEMMKPDIDGGSVDHLHLEHPVARWPLNSKGPLRPSFSPGDILSFVPSYTGDDELTSAAEEREWIRSTLGALLMKPTCDSFLELLDAGRREPVQMIHFAGHGMADSGENDGGIEMEDGPVGLMEVNQASVKLGHRDGPLIFLNACEGSAGAVMLGMNTGWGAAVAATCFGGLIAPLWAVQDTTALAMAKGSLPQLVSGEATLGAAIRDARRANADVCVAALAYLAHGDVMARFVRS